MATVVFKNSKKRTRTNEEKIKLVEVVEKYKKKYDAEVASLKGKTYFDRRRGKHVDKKPTWGIYSEAVREYYCDLKHVKHDDRDLEMVKKQAKRWYEDREKLRDTSMCPPEKKRAAGGGRKAKAGEVRLELFAWFVDVRECLKGRLPKKMFRLKAKQLYENWLQQNPTPVSERLKFGNQWIKMWEEEFGISLRKPNKRYSVKHGDRVERIQDYLKNVWYVRRFFLETYKVDPPIVNGDQMPLHRNESSQEETLNFKNHDAFVKENYNLSRERVTVFTQVSSDPSIKLQPEFVFKGKGIRAKVNVPDTIKHQWSPSGSYREEHLKKTIANLPNRYNPFTYKDMAIYVLDNYAVHLIPQIRKELFKRGYFLVYIGGGVTGDIQINDTDAHRPFKREYREEEISLMYQRLEADKSKIPTPSREDMVYMVMSSWGKVESNVDFSKAFKARFVTNSLDGSEDYLVSDKLFQLVGDKMVEYRKELMKSKVPKTILEVVRNLIPPKGVRRKEVEGMELLDCGDLIDESESVDEGENGESSDDSDTEETTDPVPEETYVQENGPANSIPGVAILENTCDDEAVNKDAKFVDNLARVLEENQTTTLFRPHLNKILVAFHAARAQVKRQIKASIEKQNDVSDENENGERDGNHEEQIPHDEASDDEDKSSGDKDENDHHEVDNDHHDKASVDEDESSEDENDQHEVDNDHHDEASDDEDESSEDENDQHEVDNDHHEDGNDPREDDNVVEGDEGDRIRAGDYVQIIKGNFYGYFAIVDPDQDEIDRKAVRITYFKEQIGRDYKYWLINELDGDTRPIEEFLKVEPISVERRGKIIF